MKLALACECVFWAVSNSLMIVIKTKKRGKKKKNNPLFDFAQLLYVLENTFQLISQDFLL